MALIWHQGTFGTGIAKIDKQHQQLFEQIDALIELSVLGEPTQEIHYLLVFLDSYAVRHFKYEEQLMEKYKSPLRAANKQGHAYFLKGVANLKAAFRQQGATPKFVAGAQALLIDWFRNHIIRIDTSLRKAAGKSAKPSKGRASGRKKGR